MQLTLEAPSLRGYAEVRRIIDEALGHGIGMSAATAYGNSPPSRAPHGSSRCSAPTPTSASRSGDESGGVHDHAVGIGARRSDDRLSDGALGRCAADAKPDRLERRGDLVEARRLEAHVVCGDYAGLDAEISAGARDRETPA